MGFKETIIGTINAALSPNQMTRQYSKPRNYGQEVWDNLTYQKEGLTYQQYNEMLLDPQVKSAYELVRMFLLSRKVNIIPASDDPKDKEIASTIDDMLHDMTYPLRKVRNDMYSALIYGYSVSEKLFDRKEGEEFISIKRIRPIPIDTLEDCFEYDDNGDLENIKQNSDSSEPIDIPPEKCLVYTYDERFGDREGNSILDAIYDSWYLKQKLLSLRQIYLQKHEGPTLAAFVANPSNKDAAREVLEDFKEGRTNGTFDKDDRVEVIESQHRGEAFDRAIEYCDMMIYRAFGIGTMIMGQQDGKGAYAQSVTQDKTLSIKLDGIHEDIAAELQIMINEVCEFNWAGNQAPMIGFETFEEKDLLTLLEKLGGLIGNMAVDPSDKWFKQLLSEVVGKYSDIDMSSLIEEDKPEDVIKPTSTDQAQTIPQEQTDLINSVTDLFPTAKQ